MIGHCSISASVWKCKLCAKEEEKSASLPTSLSFNANSVKKEKGCKAAVQYRSLFYTELLIASSFF